MRGFIASHRTARPPDDASIDKIIAEWREKDEKGWGISFRLVELVLNDSYLMITFEEVL